MSPYLSDSIFKSSRSESYVVFIYVENLSSSEIQHAKLVSIRSGALAITILWMPLPLGQSLFLLRFIFLIELADKIN